MKSAKDFLAEANAVVPRIDAKEAIRNYNDENAVFVDVRDSAAIEKSGTIAGAVRVPRGMIEFAADDSMENFYNPAFRKAADIYLVCGAGGQAALAGKTLKDMGFPSVTNIGGFGDWKEAGGATEDG